MEAEKLRSKEEIANMIQNDIAKCREFATFWLSETDPSVRGSHIDNLEEYLRDESLREICLNMLH